MFVGVRKEPVTISAHDILKQAWISTIFVSRSQFLLYILDF